MGLFYLPGQQNMDSNGDPLNGAKLFFYEVGTTTKKAIYSDKALTTAVTNPVVADSAGRWDAIFTDGAYKVVLAASTEPDPPTTAIETWADVTFGTASTFSETEAITTTTAIDSTYEGKHTRITGTSSLNLLAVSTAGEGFVFSGQNDGTGLVTLDPNASEQVNDATTWIIPPGGGFIAICDGAEWSVLGTMGIPQTMAANDILSLDSNKKMVAGKTFAGDYTFTGNLITPTDGTLTIATGAITVTGAYHLVDTEAAASIDQLDTINGGTSGQILQLRTAADARDIVITNAGNITTPDGANILLSSTGSTLSLKYDGTLSKWLVQAAAVPSLVTQGLKDRVLNGLTMSNGTDATNDIDIAAGSCVSDDGITVMTLSAITKQLDAAWAVGTNAGGLDTGTIANTTYHVWVINRTDTNVTDVLFSTSASAPTMPTNYTKKKCIGSIVRAGATILGFKQNGDEFYLNTPVLDYDSGASAGTSALTATLASVPTGVKMKAMLNMHIADNANYVYISSLDNTDAAPSTSVAPLSSGGVNATSNFAGGYIEVWTNTSAQIRVRQSTNSAAGFKLATLGWKDTRIS